MASTLTVDNIQGATTAGNVHIPGAVVQLQSTIKTDLFTTSSASFTDVTSNGNPLSITITPKYNTSKIYVFVALDYSASAGNYNNEMRLLEGSTEILRTMTRLNTNGNIIQQSNEQILRSPATTSAITYKVQVKCETGGVTYYVNQRGSGTYTGTSTITAMEIAQ